MKLAVQIKNEKGFIKIKSILGVLLYVDWLPQMETWDLKSNVLTAEDIKNKYGIDIIESDL